MNNTEFNEILERRITSIKRILADKAKEYSSEDRLYNFKRAASILNTTPQLALLGMLSKHLVSVMDLIEGRIPTEIETINEKIGDTINYLILLEALLKENIPLNENVFIGQKAGQYSLEKNTIEFPTNS